MKVTVYIKRTKELAESEGLEFEVRLHDRVVALKERISSFVRNPFPTVHLAFGEEFLADERPVAEYGVEDGASLDFIIMATEQTLVQQLSAELTSKPVSVAELGLLYSHHHGCSVTDALQVLGLPQDTLRGFLAQHKCFQLGADDMVASTNGELLTSPKHGLCSINEANVCFQTMTLNVAVDVLVQGGAKKTTELEMEFDGADTVQMVKEAISLSEMLPFPDQDLELDALVLQDHEQLRSCGVKNGSSLRLVVYASEEVVVRQLVAILIACTVSTPSELSALYCCRYGVTVSAVLKTLGLHSDIRRFLARRAEFHCEQGHVVLAQDMARGQCAFAYQQQEPVAVIACSA